MLLASDASRSRPPLVSVAVTAVRNDQTRLCSTTRQLTCPLRKKIPQQAEYSTAAYYRYILYNTENKWKAYGLHGEIH
uniref:Uncharacterized protein n=1 Tax=Mycena chlorophos TaxID=658473 RepID=A0ABQ0M9G8_MYCCL|nr:predicted protein [Mycena chlorophos]